MSGTLEKIERMLSDSRQTELSKMKANIVRVLTVYKGASWKTELFLDLAKLSEFLGEPNVIKPRILNKALGSLSSEGIITIEDKKRGAMLKQGVYADQLIRLNDLAKVKSALEKDPVFSRYTHNRDRMIKDALSERRQLPSSRLREM